MYAIRSYYDNNISKTLTINAYRSHEIMKVNRVKAVAIREGDTFEMLAQEFGLNDWEIYKYNDRNPGYRPIPNEIVYIQPKKNKTPRGLETHRVQDGESMHYISQMYGIKLNALNKRNNMKPGQEPAIGQIIHLR